MKKHIKEPPVSKGRACSQTFPELERSKSSCWSPWLSLCRAGSRSLCGFSACAGVVRSMPSPELQRAQSFQLQLPPLCPWVGNGFLPLAMPTSLPCTFLMHIIIQAPYLLGSHPQSCNVAVEIFTVTISCEGGFPGEWCRSLQDMEVGYESFSRR